MKLSTSENKVDELYQQIRDRICLLQYPPGMQLREEALASEYGVSRTPIRHVLLKLEFDELVTSALGKGYTVTTVDVKSLKEVYALRLKLAEFTGEMMVTRVPVDDIAALEDLLDQCQSLQDEEMSQEKIGRLYHEFSTIMIQNIANRPLRRISDQLFHQTARVWLDLLPDFIWEDEVNIICEEISSVLDAIREGEMIAVGEIRRDHMVRLLHRINNYLSSAEMN